MSTFPYPSITPNESTVDFTPNTQTFVSPFNGAIQTLDRGGERLGINLVHRNLKDSDRRSMMSFISRMNGQQHRVSLRDHSYTVPTGTLSIAEMLDVTFNATNWPTTAAARLVVTDISGGIRATAQYDPTGARITANGSDGLSTLTVGASYAVTISTLDSNESSSGGTAPPVEIEVRDSSTSVILHPATAENQTAGQRHIVSGTVGDITEFYPTILFNSDSTGDTGGSVDLLQLSVARCLLVDNGFNAMTKSQEFDHADWSKTRSTVSADAATAPDGTTTADELIEDSTASDSHLFLQAYTRASVAEFWTASIVIESNTSQRIRLDVNDGGNNGGYAFFDATTGTITGAATDNGTGSLSFASIHDLGGGRYRCRITSRLPATTTARIIVYLCDGAANTITFNGDGTSGLYIWGAQLQRGGQLGRYTATTTVAILGTDQTGKEVWLKGLDASTDGQLLQGDQIEVNGQLLVLDDDLDGDASGIGLARVSPRIRTAPSDESPAILYQPHGTFLMANPNTSRTNRPGGFSDFTFSFIEDITS